MIRCEYFDNTGSKDAEALNQNRWSDCLAAESFFELARAEVLSRLHDGDFLRYRYHLCLLWLLVSLAVYRLGNGFPQLLSVAVS